MEHELVQRIKGLMWIGYWTFDGLPGALVVKLDELINEYGHDELISGMRSLVPEFEKDKQETAACRGNSGTAAEIHMAAAMRLSYLSESIEYVMTHAVNKE